jgi:NADH-quinone oxidoreductase subunit D
MSHCAATELTGDTYTRRFDKGPTGDTLIVNMGPQHPSTHGVLRVIIELDGEYILRAEPVLGYVHRMHEKMGEVKSFTQYLPNMGRVDYLHAMAWNWAYVGAVEKLGGVEVPERAEYLRVIATELGRISSHLVWWGAYLLDLGAFTPIMYAFDDREIILDLLQIITGSRLTYCYFRFGGVIADVTPAFVSGLTEFLARFKSRLPMYKDLVTDNAILRKRCEEIGVIDVDMARRYGATGPVLRGSGVAYDTRRADSISKFRSSPRATPWRATWCACARWKSR